MKTLHDALREKRLEKCYRQQDIADLLGISLRQYMHYENDRWPPHEQLIKLNNIFHYDFSRHIYDNRPAKWKFINNK
jgi:transcriptional regulator with XRE-family HTH domain